MNMPSTKSVDRRLDELNFVVMCQHRNSPRWETVAAFDVEQVARAYAQGCQASNLENDYAVYPIKKCTCT
jgi:hypothetical protein